MRKKIKIKQIIRLCMLVQALSCCLISKAAAQSSLLETSITIQCTDRPLAEMLDEIKRNYHIPFSYFKNQLPLQKKITITLQNEPLQKVLDSVSMLAGIQYQAIGGQIVLKESFKNQQVKEPVHKDKSRIKKASPATNDKATIDKPYLLLNKRPRFVRLCATQ